MRSAAILLLLTSVAAPQDLPPEVLLLSRIARHLREELAHTPNYTCLETITRFHNNPGPQSRAQKQLMPLDTVRLEVVYADRREWYAPPGEASLSVENPVAFIGAGMIGNGAFAMMLANTLEGGIFTYRGEETSNGRAAVRYDYRLPRLLQTLSISIRGGKGTVGEEGAIWVDKESLDLIRMESYATEIPPYLPLEYSRDSAEYARMRIGESDALLVQSADSRIFGTDGLESYNRMDFTHCRAYSATSAIAFDAPAPEPATGAPASAPPTAGLAIPVLLRVTVELETPISDKEAVGALIKGKVSGDVMQKGKIVIPDGAEVHGRIRRLERYLGGDTFIVGLEFTQVELPGGPAPFFADLLTLDKDPRIQIVLSSPILLPGRSGPNEATERIVLPELPGVASFFVRGARLTLPSGFRTVWRTRGPIH